MKVIGKAIKPLPVSMEAQDLAAALLTLIPRMMATLRGQLQSVNGVELRGGQFRLLMIINSQRGISISEAAQLMGLTVPTTSKITDELTQQGLLARNTDVVDRRRARLSLTAHGKVVLETVSREARSHLAELLTPLTPMERAFLLCAVETLRPLFAQPGRISD